MKVMFVSIGTYGLIAPLLGAAAELTRHGHSPIFLTHQRGRKMVEQAGFVSVKVTGRSGLNIEGWCTPHQAIPQFRLVERAIAKQCPDVVVTDHLATGAIMAARAFAVPVAVLGPATYIYPIAGILPDSPSAIIRLTRYTQVLNGYKETARLLGLPPTQDESPFLGDRYLLRSVPSFEPYTALLPDRVRFVGACLYETPRVDKALSGWLQSNVEDRPIALIQIEKLFDSRDPIPLVLTLLRERGIWVAAALGSRFGKYRRFASVSSFITNHLPQKHILTRARFAISTGQPTSVLGAVCAGVPNLILDFGSGAPETLDCCVRAGNGIGIPGIATNADSLTAAVNRLMTDAAIKSNAVRIQRAFGETDSFAAIAEVLTEIVAGRLPYRGFGRDRGDPAHGVNGVGAPARTTGSRVGRTGHAVAEAHGRGGRS